MRNHVPARAIARFVIRCLVSLAVCGSAAAAQDYVAQTGAPPFAVNAGIENGSIDLANGNLHLEFPLGSFPQRGGWTLAYRLAYDSRIWHVVNTGTAKVWQPTNVPNSWGGWRLVSNADPGSVNYASSTAACGSGQTSQTWSNFTWTESSGVVHLFPVTTSQNPCTGQNTPSGDAYALDSSGFHLYVTNNTSARVVSRGGVQVYPAFKDTNGNYLSTDGSGNLVDTLGRTPVKQTVSGSSVYLDVLNSQGTTSRWTLTLGTINVNTNFGQSGVTEYSGSFQAVEKITLPDSTSDYWGFGYDSSTSAGYFGQIYQMNFPTMGGGTGVVNYTHGTFQDALGNRNRWVTQHKRTDGTNTDTWTFAQQVLSTCAAGQVGCQQQVTLTSPYNDQTVYTFTLDNGAWNTLVKRYAGSSTLLLTTQTDYDFSNACPSGVCTGHAYVRPIRITSTEAVPSGSVAKKAEYGYDTPQYANMTSVKEWGYYAGASFPTAPDRETDATFSASNAAYAALDILNRPLSKTTYGAGVQVRQTLVSYDGSAPTPVTGVVNHDDANYGASVTTRGNPTGVQRWVGGSTYTSASSVYDTTGQVVQGTDANGNAIAYGYADAFYTDNGSTPASVYAPAQPTNAYRTQSTRGGLTSGYGYYFGSGKLARSIDPNGNDGWTHYVDPMDRTSSRFGSPLSSGARPWALYSYPNLYDAESYVGITDTTASTGCTGCLHDRAFLDTWLRPHELLLVNDPDGETYNVWGYDPFNRLGYGYNPYRSTSDATYGEEQYTFDPLGRPLKLSYADGNTQQWAYGANAGSYTQQCAAATYGTGFPMLFTDEAGKKRLSWYDGLGRLVEVDEANASNVPSVPTCYRYDALNNLAATVQGSQSRTRVYDGLSRLVASSDPESGLTCYGTPSGSACAYDGYDGNGNLLKRVDARGTTTTYTYDALDRMTSASYSDATPRVAYSYDQASLNGLTITNGKGRRTGMQDGTGQTAWSYDAAGNLLAEQRTVGAVTKTTGYSYNLDGSVASIAYPTGHTVAYTYGQAQRELAAVDSANGITFASAAKYAPQGKLASVVYGKSSSFAGITRSRGYNNRLQATSIADSSANGSITSYGYSYNLGGGANNGNVATITDNLVAGRTQTFAYDPLNRLSSAATQATSGADCWGQSFAYDQYGNLTGATPTQCSAPQLSLSVNGANQITNTGFAYDAAGNMTADGSQTYAFDGENRLVSATGSSGTTTYGYDGDGRRVQASSGVLTWYDFAGHDVAETDASGNLQHEYVYFAGRRVARRDAGGAVYYYFSDRLHSGRAVTDATGHVQQQSTFFPYGQEQVATAFDPHKFTGKKRDAESGLDQARMRMYHPTLGRWLSTDPAAAHPARPQTWNRYTYVVGNPLTFTDPQGTDLYDDTWTGGMMDDGSGRGGSVFLGATDDGDPSAYAPAPQAPPDPAPFSSENDPVPSPDPPSTDQEQQSSSSSASQGQQGSAPSTSTSTSDDGSTIKVDVWAPSTATKTTAVAAGAGALCFVVEPCGAAVATGATFGVLFAGAAYAIDGGMKYFAKSEQRLLDHVAKSFCVDRRELGRAVEEEKRMSGRGPKDNLSAGEIKEIARTLPKVAGCKPTEH